MNEYSKKYREEHKEEKIMYDKQYREKNADRLNEYDRLRNQVRNKIKIVCLNCDSEVCLNSISRHKKTHKCKSHVKPSDNEN